MTTHLIDPFTWRSPIVYDYTLHVFEIGNYSLLFRLPPYACKFLEMCLMVTADHGPAVSGAHNTIVAARAGKDLVSSLASGLLTVGERSVSMENIVL